MVGMPRRLSKVAFSFTGLLVMVLGAGAVDLTPRYIDTFIDGVANRRLYFTDGEKKIGVSLDHETKVEAGAGGVVFRFPKYPDATFLIKPSPMTADQPFEGIALERYREAARRFLPPGATNIKALEEVADPLPINRWTSRRFAFTCDSVETAIAISVTFLNLNAEDQLVLVTTSTTRNFAEAAERSFQIIRTWQELLPGDEKRIKNN